MMLLGLLLCCLTYAEGSQAGWQDASLPLATRVEDLISKLTLDEKISQLNTDSPAVERLGISSYNWWWECLHGAQERYPDRYGGTIYPQPIGLAATFNMDLIAKIAVQIGDELRAMNNDELKRSGTHRALNCFGPNINIFRDPRWGRGSETYGEDPQLMARVAVALVQGLQGTHDKYLKIGATCKHFAAYSLEEAEGISRFAFDAQVSQRDWADTYSPAFDACTKAGKARSVMCSYNAINGTPACADPHLLGYILRGDWSWDGFVVSDCAAVEAVYLHHNYTRDLASAAADSLAAGCDMSCVDDYKHLKDAVARQLITEQDVDAALRRVLGHRFHLGMFDPVDQDPWRTLEPEKVLGAAEHMATALQAARESIVLLKNMQYPDGSTALPLDPQAGGKIVVLGAFADTPDYLLGNYYGHSSGEVVTPLQAIRDKLGDKEGSRVHFVGGQDPIPWNTGGTISSELACRDAAVCIVFVGSSMANEHTGQAEGMAAGRSVPLYSAVNEAESQDRLHIRLPGSQENMIKAIAKRTSAKLIVVLIHGGPLDVSWAHNSKRVGGILTGWYPGHGAQAIADVLFGDYSPSGKLPVTFYFENYTQQQSMLNMDMRAWPGRTYRFLQVPVLYPFAYGLSYTTFTYTTLTATPQPGCGTGGGAWHVTVDVKNTGHRVGDEVVMLFLTHSEAQAMFALTGSWVMPQKDLKAFKRIHLGIQATATVEFTLRLQDFTQANEATGVLEVASGDWLIQVEQLVTRVAVPKDVMQKDCTTDSLAARNESPIVEDTEPSAACLRDACLRS